MNKITREECSKLIHGGLAGQERLWSRIQEVQSSEPMSVEADGVKWIVNNLGELGVEIQGKQFFLYKGGSLVYWDAVNEDGTAMKYREVYKREFGECQHPEGVNASGVSNYSFGDGWKEIPKREAPGPKVTPKTTGEKRADLLHLISTMADPDEIDELCKAAGIPTETTE